MVIGSKETCYMLKTLARATRVHYLPVLVNPLALGAALSWREGNRFRPAVFGLCMFGSTAAHLASNMTNDYFDYIYGTDEQADVEPGSVDTGSGTLTHKVLSTKQVQGIMLGLYSAALASCVVLTQSSGPPALVMSISGFALGYFYTAPPVRLCYVGRGLGEVDLMLAFGVLPALGTYYTQCRKLSWQPVIGSVPLGILTALVLFNHHFLHWRSDRACGKMSPVARLGEVQALKVSKCIALAGFGSVLTGVATKALPASASLALTTAPKLFKAISQAEASKNTQGYMKLLMVTLQTSIRTGALLLGAVTFSGIIRRFIQSTKV